MIPCDRDFGNTMSGGPSCSNSNSSSNIEMNSRYSKLSTPSDICKLSVMHANCQSAMNKRSEICSLIDSENPQILSLTEFGASANVSDGELGIDGYSLYRGNHTSGGGGLGKGVALYIKNSLNHSACPLLDKTEFNCSVWCTVLLSDGKKLLIGVVYRSPNSPDDNNERMLQILRSAASTKADYLVICGDFNLPRIDWSANQCLDTDASFTARFLETIEDLGWVQHSKNDTRFRGSQRSCLDLVFTNEADMIDEILELPPIGKSDHVCQKWMVTVKEAIYKNTTFLRPNFKKANWTGIRDEVDAFNFEPGSNAGKMMDDFLAMINGAKKTNIPVCKPRSLKHRLPWMRGSKIKVQRSKRWTSWKKFKESGLPRDYDAYKVERNRLNDMVRSAKSKYERSLISDLKENPNLYYGHCRRSLKTKQGVTNVVDGSGKLTETEEETAAALNTYYHSVFTYDDGKSEAPAIPMQTQERLSDITIRTELVEEVLQSLNANKAAGPDGMETRVLKECAEELAPKLQEIFSRSLEEGTVPRQWREAHIVPIHKGGSKATMGNFRPVALTSAICKVLEKIVCAAMISFLSEHKLISPQQHGFLRGRSCQTNIMLCLERWTQILDDGKSVDVAFFDYSKAFDKVSHRLLLIKLKAYGFDGKLLVWIEAWLTDRKQRVVVGGAKSSWLEVVSGTTQGTVLGFLLFLVYINDLPEKCSQQESLIMLLADDTKTFQEIDTETKKQEENHKEMQDRIDRIAQWASDWKMEINPGKSKVMHLGNNNPNHSYHINQTEITTVTTEKDIGFWISNDLSNSTHVHKARSRALGEIARIKRNFSFIDKQAFCVLYNQRVRPHLDYGMTACPPDSAAEAKLLERVQAKATALVHGLRGFNSEERRKKLGLMTLEERRERGDLMEVFKILKGLTKIDPTEFWEVRDARNGARLVKELASKGKRQRKNFFSYRVVQKWNLLPMDLKTAPSLDSFKNRLDKKIMANSNS